MPRNPDRDETRSPRRFDFRWLWLVMTVALAAIVIAFRRFRSNERVAQAVAAGTARRRGELTSTTTTEESTT